MQEDGFCIGEVPRSCAETVRDHVGFDAGSLEMFPGRMKPALRAAYQGIRVPNKTEPANAGDINSTNKMFPTREILYVAPLGLAADY